jgi:hypothetical protein
MNKNLISAYVGEALHTSSGYLLNRDFDLSFGTMADDDTAYHLCLQREQEVYSKFV